LCLRGRCTYSGILTQVLFLNAISIVCSASMACRKGQCVPTRPLLVRRQASGVRALSQGAARRALRRSSRRVRFGASVLTAFSLRAILRREAGNRRPEPNSAPVYVSVSHYRRTAVLRPAPEPLMTLSVASRSAHRLERGQSYACSTTWRVAHYRRTSCRSGRHRPARSADHPQRIVGWNC